MSCLKILFVIGVKQTPGTLENYEKPLITERLFIKVTESNQISFE